MGAQAGRRKEEEKKKKKVRFFYLYRFFPSRLCDKSHLDTGSRNNKG